MIALVRARFILDAYHLPDLFAMEHFFKKFMGGFPAAQTAFGAQLSFVFSVLPKGRDRVVLVQFEGE